MKRAAAGCRTGTHWSCPRHLFPWSGGPNIWSGAWLCLLLVLIALPAEAKVKPRPQRVQRQDQGSLRLPGQRSALTLKSLPDAKWIRPTNQIQLSGRLHHALLGAVRLHNKRVTGSKGQRGPGAAALGQVLKLASRALEQSDGLEGWTAQLVLQAAVKGSGPAADSKLSRKISPHFKKALSVAIQLHQYQQRKGTRVPYLAHLLGVAGRVLVMGGSEVEAIAALLHDAVEDQGGQRTLRMIRRRFGGEVASIVAELSDDPRGSWRVRKQHTIDAIAQGRFSAAATRIKLADNLHNISASLREVEQKGSSFWTSFSGGKAGRLWYYRSLAAAYREAGVDPVQVQQLEHKLMQLELASR